MKKILSIFLAIIMVFTLSACGEKAPAEAATQPTNAPSTEPTQAPTAAPTEAIEEAEPVEVPAFDNTWASNDFEKLIPQPPFEGWTGKQTDEKTYEMETSQADADGSGTYYDTFGAYADTLRDCGFTMEGDTYMWEGVNEQGTFVELKCGDGFAWITITSAEPLTAGTPAPVGDSGFDSGWTENPFEKLIPQPPFEGWTGREMAPNLYMMTCTNGNEADWEVYAQILTSADFSLEDVGKGYKGYDAMGNYFEFMCTENQAMIMIETVG